ncbi:MAG TPA: glycoside hydrolase family 18 protein [Candidatus Sulfotelmatobacter sp.]|nr:glycoside hydrolase family 18 protein [Candidatus Sulfotelmatobacter sp.]
MPSLSNSATRFLPYSFAAALLFSSLLQAQNLPNHLSKRVVGDYGYWSKYQDPPYSAAQIPYHKLTHINHAGVSFDPYGSLSVPDGFIEPELNNSAHAAGVKVLLLLGGNFNGLELTGALPTLVDNIAAMEKQYGYDGVDIDWEYPATSRDRGFLVELMAKLRESNSDYVLSIDAAPWGGYGYDLKHLSLSLDYVNIMMYDCAGPWTAYGQLNSAIFWDPRDPAPWECQPGGSVRDAADIFLHSMRGEQLNMGTPFYGYYYDNINKEFGLCPNSAWTADGACDYAVLTGNYGTTFKPLINKNGWRTYRDPIALVPYMLRVDGSNGYITYDDAFSTYFRVWYSDWQRGLGGTFMWSLDADYDGHSQDLMDAMYSASLSAR